MSINENWTHLYGIVHKAIDAIERKGKTHAEAFFTSTRETEVTIRNSEILTQNASEDSGVGFRVVAEKNRVGFACTNTLSEKAVLETAEKALHIARVSPEVSDFALPCAEKPIKVNGLFDSRIVEIAMEEVVDVAKRAMEAAENFDKRVIVKDGRVLFTSGWRGITNTLGVDCEEKETRAVIYLGGTGEQNGEVTGRCYDFFLGRTKDLEPEPIGESVGKMVIEMFGPKPLKSFQGTVIFGSEAVSDQLADVLVYALKGENIISGRSAWVRKLGETVASENLTVTDDATLERGFASRSFDDEGCSSKNTMIIRKGSLEGFLHNASSAKALKTENTANASRFPGGFDMLRMIGGNGYRAKPEIYPSNLKIQPGKKTKEELVSEMSEGVLIESMSGFAQAASGVISTQLSRAFYIQHGEIKYPIKGGMVSGVAFDWLKQVAEIGKDARQFQNSVMPSLCIENVRVVGA